ncbi:S-adenosyl-L-methionine-dependent methyltransferase, partial [Rozella allomycis CSF55]
MNFPDAFIDFLNKEGVDPKVYSVETPRYFIWNTLYPLETDTIEKEFPGVLKLEPPYDYIIGIDLSSLVAVETLDINPNDKVLDLCCAPGNNGFFVGVGTKLSVIASKLGDSGIGSVTGVDISLSRLNNCRSIMKRMKVNKARVYCTDGTTFDKLAPDELPNIFEPFQKKRKTKLQKSDDPTLFHESYIFKRRANISCNSLYDKVLVDAECTHDGSLRHILKSCVEFNQWDNFLKRIQDQAALEGLYDLQYRLLENGYKLLKPDGVLVYST